MSDFPKGPTFWVIHRTLFVSVPFTWDLPILRNRFANDDFLVDRIIVGGPAVRLMPDFFDDMPWVKVEKGDLPGVMQRVHPLATKTSTGCVRKCPFCAVPKMEGDLVELDDWPDLPIITDNNLLATTERHFDRVMDRLEHHRGVDFNQGLDCRLLTPYHAERIERLKLAKRGVRLSLDHIAFIARFEATIKTLLDAGIAKRNISSYAIVGFDSDPAEAWARCKAIEAFKVRALPMWFHELDAMEPNTVTEKQAALGWNDYERRKIMQWFYQHKQAV